jgi:DNA-binding PadR family transcriptional regulator
MAMLGLLFSMGPAHGYELRTRLENANMHNWADVQLNSIYASLKQLTRDGLIELVETTREGNRPPRDVYRVTTEGRAALLDLLREAWAQPHTPARPIDMALQFAFLLPADEVRELLARRIVILEGRKEDLDVVDPTVQSPVPWLDAIVRDLFEHTRRVVQFEIDWARHLDRRVASGVYNPGPAPETGRRS